MSKPIDIPFETTLRVRDTCLCLHLQRAARASARRFDEALRPLPDERPVLADDVTEQA